MVTPLCSDDSSLQVASCVIPGEAIRNAQYLADQYSLKTSCVLGLAVAVVSGTYNYSETVTQATATITKLSPSPIRLSIDHVEIRTIEIDQNRKFRDAARTLSNKDLNSEANVSLPTKKRHQGVDALVCVYEVPGVASKSLVDERTSPEWVALFDRFGCNIIICFPGPFSLDDGFVIQKPTGSAATTPMSFAATFARILESGSRQPMCEVHQLDYLGESDEILIRRRNKHVAHPKSVCLHETISSQARKRPNAPAVCATDGDLTHKELDSLSTRLANHLAKKGLGPGAVVPLCFEKSKFMIISMLAILKTGAACTMLEASLPTERLQNMIQQVSASLLLGSGSQVSRFQGSTENLEIDQSFLDQLAGSKKVALPETRPSDVALILFTSGSTGTPKGMLHEHVTINTSLHALAQRLKLDGTTRISQFAAYSFDLSMIEILLPLIVGGCVCIPSEDSRLSNLANCMEEMSVNFAMLTPSSVKLLRPQDIPTMKMIMVGGEPITGELIRIWGSSVKLINAWGTSECGICSCVVVDRSMPTSVGTCMGMGAWIVDPRNTDRLLPVGAVGELIVEGPQVARGYLGDPEKTSATFIKSAPWLKRAPQGRLYRTGDLMRYLPDTSMEYCGRKDLQVKVRGCRIELGEVEYHVTANDLVRNAMVLVPKKGIYSGRLVAIVQLNNSFDDNKPCKQNEDPTVHTDGDDDTLGVSLDNIDKYVASKLSSQSVPEKWIVVDQLPISKSDKVDRKKITTWLELFHKAVAPTPSTSTKPAAMYDPDPMLRKISKIVVDAIAQGADASDANIVNSYSRLKTLGIDSLSVITVSAAILETFEIRIPVKVLLDSSLDLIGLVNLVRKYASLEDAEKYPSPPKSESSSCSESCKALEDYQLSKTQLLAPLQPPGRRVFLTGATGYVGSYILRSLLVTPGIDKVHVLVRARTQELAVARIVAAARSGKWWTEALMLKLEVWLGDLSLPNLGLSAKHLCMLKSAPGRESEAIDAIVHNGAVVHWLADYEELRPTNVGSTQQLLNIARHSTCISKFVFIASDPEFHFDVVLRDDKDLADYLSQISGYRQTKGVSEMLVRSMASATESASPRYSWIKPGFVIGSKEDGVVNVDDFLWRLAASVVRLGVYDSNEATGWIYVASVDAITERVLNTVCGDDESVEDDGAIVAGMNAQDFWELLESVSGRPLKPMPHDQWLALLRQDVFHLGKQHPLWPLLHLIEDEDLTLGTKGPCPNVHKRLTESVSHIVRKGMQYLDDLGLLSKGVAWPGEDTSCQVFKRSKRSSCLVGEGQPSMDVSLNKRIKRSRT